MVGVPKSTGCFICRKRKIKCDETWPTCLNCRKNNKCCPGPPARHTFKDLGPRLSRNTSTVYPEDVSGIVDQNSKRLTQLNEKWSEGGAVFQKFRISSKDNSRTSRSPRSSSSTYGSLSPAPLRQPSPTQHDGLARALVETLSTGSIGHRMGAFGPFIRGIPARIGHNAALDAAVACLVNAHTSMVQKKGASEVANPVLYLRAVQTLQTCLEDPQQGMSSTTLCASVLLGLVEALAGPRMGNQYLAHVGGAGRLMELQGPMKCHDRFAKEVLRFNRGGIIITSIYKRRPCFLTSPEWRDIAFDKTGLNFEDCLYTDILHRMADFPSLLREFKDIENGSVEPLADFHPFDFTLDIDLENLEEDLSSCCPSLEFSSPQLSPLSFLNDPYQLPPSHLYSAPRTDLLNKLQSLKDSLIALSIPLNAKLTDGTAAIELPAIDSTSPIPTAFHFTNWRVTVAYNCFWSLLILTNKLIMKLLPPYDPLHYVLEAECRTVAYEICKTWEDAWASRPIGAFHTGLSFVMAYEYCTEDVQCWILSGLNSLLDGQGVESFRWTEDVVRGMSEKLAGEGPDMVFAYREKGDY
ncbi:hypothetical protein K491DRAFT_610545 [Lophiostoma macrostomum CBS 122681]|uniref:Zn(2)-C6 fungal-type domain-containing protein n=1 Tax=Lophiostoma macrostomum CBS 122681 TaxID=1314788 RepID=A0A6A6SSY6_9PLEO|nr:hypothetical protein K491DRAFT_610545 [Lophiostoma macrostomum CBS 122681]